MALNINVFEGPSTSTFQADLWQLVKNCFYFHRDDNLRHRIEMPNILPIQSAKMVIQTTCRD